MTEKHHTASAAALIAGSSTLRAGPGGRLPPARAHEAQAPAPGDRRDLGDRRLSLVALLDRPAAPPADDPRQLPVGGLPPGDAADRGDRPDGRDAAALGALAAHHRVSRAGRGGSHRSEGPRHPGRRGDPDARRVPRVRDVPRRARRDPRRGILFEGPPGTGKTYLAKAMAKQAGVPFLFISATALQSMWFGMTAYRIRSFFKALRKTARKEGGAIGFIEEIDAIAQSRDGVAPRPGGSGGHGALREPVHVVQHGRHGERAPDPDAVLRPATLADPGPRQVPRMAERVPAEQLAVQDGRARVPQHPADRGDEPGGLARHRADATRVGSTGACTSTSPRRASARTSSTTSSSGRSTTRSSTTAVRTRIAHESFGYTPVMIEHLFDEALLVALRDGRREMNFSDVMEAKFTEEIGLKQAVTYTDNDRSAVAVHEAGHATVAHFLGQNRRLEVLSIIKRRGSLGLLAHGDQEERFTRTRTEIESGIAIALGGLVAEELVLGESGTGPGERPDDGDAARGPDGGLVRDGGLADLVRRGLPRPDRRRQPRGEGPGRRAREAGRRGHPGGTEGAGAGGPVGEPRRPLRPGAGARGARRARPRRDPPR